MPVPLIVPAIFAGISLIGKLFGGGGYDVDEDPSYKKMGEMANYFQNLGANSKTTGKQLEGLGISSKYAGDLDVLASGIKSGYGLMGNKLATDIFAQMSRMRQQQEEGTYAQDQAWWQNFGQQVGNFAVGGGGF